MTLPKSFNTFKVPAPRKFLGLMIGTEGGANSGKSEFALSAPGPGIMLPLDRQIDGVLLNPKPPESRQEDFLIIPVPVVLPQAATQAQAQACWKEFYISYLRPALQNPDARTVVLDGDSDSFELQMLAEFGRTTQIPQIQRTSLNASRRAMIAEMSDSGKIIIATNKLKRQYDKVWDEAGNPVPDPQKPGEQLATWDGVSYSRQGFNDHEYLWQIQLRHLYNREKGIWGLKILLCKPDRSLEGYELWGDDCHMPALLETVFPHIPLARWGY